ncbi:uncharacterized protein [Triticum aestivum]|uniref:uncharacterized protein n=1 Tax=Triticum aestivum TaxID=4565 RepID=UPI001D002CE9|nr:uncharacterized protein LOC123052776 [Triticum aestivum]
MRRELASAEVPRSAKRVLFASGDEHDLLFPGSSPPRAATPGRSLGRPIRLQHDDVDRSAGAPIQWRGGAGGAGPKHYPKGGAPDEQHTSCSSRSWRTRSRSPVVSFCLWRWVASSSPFVWSGFRSG